jgi:MFS family permease
MRGTSTVALIDLMASPFVWYRQADARVRRVFWTCSAAWALDSMDALVYSFMIPTLMVAFGMTLVEAQAINTANFVSAAVGGWVGGLLCDRFGRARLLQITILWFSVFSFLSGFAQSYEQLFVIRVLQGLGFGAEWAVGAVLLGEMIAPAHRGKAVGTVQSAAPIGTGMAALLAGPLVAALPAEYGWRVVFWIGMLPALLVFFVRRADDDSQVYLQARRRLLAEQRTVYPWAIFAPQVLRITVLTSLLAIGIQGAAYSISNYLSVFLQNERGLSAKVAGLYILINSAGGFIGAQVNAYCSDSLGRRRMFRLFGVGFVIMASFYLLAPLGNSAWTLLPAGMVYGFFQFGLYASFGPYFTELFPTEIRGSGQAFAYNLGRAMSGLAFTMPVAWLIANERVGISTGMLIGALSGIVLAIFATLLLPETAGRDLAESVPERGVMSR